MDRSCKNCYWSDMEGNCFHYGKEKLTSCDSHKFVCSECISEAEYKYNGKCYCTDCLLDKFDIEEALVKQYFINGNLLGTDEDMDEVMENLDEDIEIIED